VIICCRSREAVAYVCAFCTLMSTLITLSRIGIRKRKPSPSTWLCTAPKRKTTPAFASADNHKGVEAVSIIRPKTIKTPHDHFGSCVPTSNPLLVLLGEPPRHGFSSTITALLRR
jgi:hypothetical protein